MLDLLEKTALTGKRLKALEEEAVYLKAKSLLGKLTLRKSAEGNAGPVMIVESYANEGMEEVLSIGRAAQKLTSSVIILASVPDLKIAAFCSDKKNDLRPLIKKVFDAEGGRGGGGPSFYQGSFGSVEAMKAFIGSFENPPEPA